MLLYDRAPSVARKPVIIVAGFLGAGKTTLVNRIVTSRYGARIGLVVNEFGSIGIDHHLMLSSDDQQVIQLNNGCICCSMRGDLIRNLFQLAEMRAQFDAVVIETTGLADPGPIAHSLFADDAIRLNFELQSVITLVDAKHFATQLREEGQAVNQVGFADLVLLNKTDLVSEDELAALEADIRGINSAADIRRTRNSDIEIDTILGPNAAQTHRQPGAFACFDAGRPAAPADKLTDIETVAFTAPGALDPLKLSQWFRALLSGMGPQLLRMKGVLNIRGDDDRFFFQGVRTDFEGRPGAAWAPDDDRLNRLVFIGRGLDRAAIMRGFDECLSDAADPADSADRFGRINVEISTQRLDQIRFWIRQNFMLAADIPIVVKEVPCMKPACPPIETAILALLRDAPPLMFKVQRPIGEITFDHIYDLMENPMPCC